MFILFIARSHPIFLGYAAAAITTASVYLWGGWSDWLAPRRRHYTLQHPTLVSYVTCQAGGEGRKRQESEHSN